MNKLVALIVLALSFSSGLAKEAQPLAEDPAVEKRMIAITEEMRCLVCQNESLAGSRADLANDLRREIRELIRQGKTDEEIKTFMVSRYGDFVLYRPPVKSTTWLLWGGPFLFLIAGIALLFAYLKRRKRDLAAAGASGEAVAAPLSEDENRRAQAFLKESEP